MWLHGRVSAPLPYPLPDKWRLKAAKKLRRWHAALWTVVGAVFVWLAFASLLGGDFGLGILFTIVFAIIGLAMGVGFERTGAESGLPHLLNAVVLSDASERPPDSWIHFFRERGPGLWLTVCFAAVGLLGSVALGWAVVLSIAQGGGGPWSLVLTIPLLLGALVVALAGVIAIVLRWRHASFGRRPIGVSVARQGVVRYYLDGADLFPWEKIREVRPTVGAVDKSTGDFTPGIEIVLDESEPGPHERHYDIGGYESHAWLIYTAVRFWAEHPALREELSTTRAQKRITAWRDAMRGLSRVPAAPPPPSA